MCTFLSRFSYEIKWQRTSALCDVMVCCQAAAGEQAAKLVNNQRVKVI